MKGNFHVRFLEGDGLATARPYSVRDMKSQRSLLIWTRPDKSCVSPQVFYGSMRLTRRVRRVKPPRQWSKLGSLNPGAH